MKKKKFYEKTPHQLHTFCQNSGWTKRCVLDDLRDALDKDFDESDSKLTFEQLCEKHDELIKDIIWEQYEAVW